MLTDKQNSTVSMLLTRNGGIESFFDLSSDNYVKQRIASVNDDPISKVQLDQLLGLRKEKAVSDDFFQFYWLSEPSVPYKLSAIYGYSNTYKDHEKIISIDHLLYGFYRIYVDGLLCRGNVRAFYREFSSATYALINAALADLIFNTEAIKRRGPTLPLNSISKDDRYLISEIACKSYGALPASTSDLKVALLDAWEKHEERGGGAIVIKELLDPKMIGKKHAPKQGMFEFSADDILKESVSSRADLEQKYSVVAEKFQLARKSALENTKLYLSLVNDLDVYVATSMRKRDDFRAMADRCEKMFAHQKVADLNLRYFDPTLSAADGHQDKGLIECLMVKCAKVLVYCAGDKESFGKDAEAAMALSLGKPVIFLCDEEVRKNFYREVHPLSRLIDFRSGVAVGAIVTSSESDAAELLDRIFENEMEYELRQPKERPGFLQLVERITESVIRLQIDDELLAAAFWNYYKSH